MIRSLVIKIMTFFVLRKSKEKRKSADYISSSDIGVLYSEDSEGHTQSHVDDLIRKFKKDEKNIRCLVYQKGNDDNNSVSYSKKDYSKLGRWKNKEIIDFTSVPFDYLVCTDSKLNNYTKNILAISKAKCRVGKYESNSTKYFELMINYDGIDHKGFISQLYHYITSIRNE